MPFLILKKDCLKKKNKLANKPFYVITSLYFIFIFHSLRTTKMNDEICNISICLSDSQLML